MDGVALSSNWKIEGSHDDKAWTEIVSLEKTGLAYTAFEVALDRAEYNWVRLVSPKGDVVEKLRTDN